MSNCGQPRPEDLRTGRLDVVVYHVRPSDDITIRPYGYRGVPNDGRHEDVLGGVARFSRSVTGQASGEQYGGNNHSQQYYSGPL
ncbi:MAG: hypothetical protein F4140_08040 [Cenarchaeum sp. SB0675_bin_21]|nr:hypothetical protein [Cenarchaeum sp. SB0675_bin_21]